MIVKKLTFAFAVIILSTNMMAQTIDLNQIKQTKKISVTGMAELEVEPDEISVVIELREYYKDKQKIDIEPIKKQFMDACVKAGIADDNIRLQNVGGYNVNNFWDRKKRKDPDFFASVSYIVKIGNTKIMDQLIARLDENATVNLYVSKLSNSKENEYRKTIKQDALKNAREKAIYMCDAIGEKVGGAIYIEEVNNEVYYPPMGKAMMMATTNAAADNMETTSTEFQKIKIRYEVRAEFEIK